MADLDMGALTSARQRGIVEHFLALGRDSVLRVANGTAFGRVAGVWTRDGGRQMRMARALKCGQCSSTTMAPALAWNCRSAASSTPATGVKRASRRCTASRR